MNLASLMRITNQAIYNWWIFSRAVFSVTAYGIEIVFRRKLGERYIDGGLFMLTMLVAWSWSFIISPRMILSGRFLTFGLVQVTYVIIMLIAIITHARAVQRRNAQGEEWHSYSNGISRFQGFRSYSKHAMDMWVEPVIIFALGFAGLLINHLISLGFDVLGTYFMVGALSLFGKRQIIHREQRTQYLDAKDAQIESKVMKDLLDGGLDEQAEWPEPATMRGVTIAAPRPCSKKAYDNLAEVFVRLDPSLQAFLDNEKNRSEADEN